MPQANLRNGLGGSNIPALAGIGLPFRLAAHGAAPPVYQIYTGGPAVGSSISLPVSTSAGDVIVACVNANGVATGVSDSQGNTYVQAAAVSGDNTYVWVAAYNGSPGTPTKALVAGTDTVTISGSLVGGGVMLLGVTGCAPAAPDVALVTHNASTSTPSGPATGTLPQPGDIIIYALLGAWSPGVTAAFPSNFSQVSYAPVSGGSSVAGWGQAQDTSSVTPTAVFSSATLIDAFTIALAPASASTTQSGGGTLTGQGSLSAAPVFAAAGAMSGSGTLGAAPVLPAAAAMSGQGSLSATPAFASAATLSGQGTLTVSGAQLSVSAGLTGLGSLAASPVLSAAAALSGLGSLAAAPVFAGAAVLSGQGTLSASGLIISTKAALSGLGTLTGSPVFQAAAVLSGLGSLTGSPVFNSAAAMSGSGTLSAAPILTGSANLSGVGTLGTVPLLQAAAALSGLGTLSGLWTFGDSSVMSGTGTLLGNYGGGATGSAALSGLGTLTASPVLSALAGLSGLGTLAGQGQLAGAAALSGLGSLSAGARMQAAAAMSGAGSLAAAPVLAALATLAGSGTLSGVSRMTAAALLSGQGSLTVSYQVSWQVTALLSGVGTLGALPQIQGAGDTGTVDWLAGPSDRWNVVPTLPRWLAGLLRPRWLAAVFVPRWTAAPAPPRWEIVMATFEPVSALSLEEINITWTSDLDGTTIDPTQLTVQFAVPVSSGILASPAQPVTWYAAAWLAGGIGKGYVAQGLVGPGGGAVTLVAGTKYDVWGKILGSPEQPVKFVGVLPVY